ncbi:ferrioxamine uptake transcriptional regulator FoxR [Castellaniella ginsengisoli]|uniref:Ferrioxamine uptake transcriptional regulator FoxR n=1 Tax=Castellaniella ginsengisoli TaxID=546114 RepID=A0ABN1KVJ5_9BURK
MDITASPTALQSLSVADLRDFGDRFGIDYCFPSLPLRQGGAAVLRGRVEELPLSCGLYLTHSRLEVLRPYETLSTRNTAFFLLVVLEGCVRLSIAGRQHAAGAGMAIITHLDAQTALHAAHASGQHLHTLTIALNTDPAAPDMPAWLQAGFPHPASPSARLWQVPGPLYQSLLHWQTARPMGPLQQRLLMEGMMLQLLAHGLDDASASRAPGLAPAERARLEKIRRQLDCAPDQEYSVQQLAEQAAMSTSSFRSKFRQMFGMPVQAYQRCRRLELARRYLLQGYSVQQAAHLSGYRHTTNFATAFRKHYGMAPSSLN